MCSKFTIKIYNFQNVDRSVEKGIASRMNVKTITTDNLYEKLNEMLSNPMYNENMKIISKCFKDQKELPLERALWWIEWVLRNPKSIIWNRAKTLNFFQIQSIDVISTLTVVTLIVTYIVVLLLKKIFIFIFQRTKIANKDKNDWNLFLLFKLTPGRKFCIESRSA